MDAEQISFLSQTLPLVLLSLILAIMAHKLAREKGRNTLLWTILGIIPVINLFCVWYFVGAVNSRLEDKIDGLTDRMQ